MIRLLTDSQCITELPILDTKEASHTHLSPHDAIDESMPGTCDMKTVIQLAQAIWEASDAVLTHTEE